MIRLIRPLALLGLLFVTNCQQTVTPPPLLSLSRSGGMSVICRDMTSGQGQDINGCPDAYATTWDGRHTLLMVTQQERGEVAVIDMTTRVVLDEDPTVPGTEFLPIGKLPVAITSTPGGASTFVATAEPGREAIFALPTSCAVAPSANQPPRDLTQWSACKLPAAPGEMTILSDATLNSGGEFRRTCDGDGVSDVDPITRSDCPADWDAEQQISPAGRRKLLVTLPTLGGVAILDARNLFDRVPGTFGDCTIERWLPLSPSVPTGVQEQRIPADLVPSDPSCTVTPRYSVGPPPSGFVAKPAGIAVKEGQLYVADMGTPLVHVLNVKDPCDPHELPPLLPSSYDVPTRPVYTSSVAVSDLTSKGERFVYAVDSDDGSILAFDVSPNATQKTPIIRDGTKYLPYYSPDRIQTNLQNASVKDLLFVTHDVPIVDVGSATSATGIQCNPNPAVLGETSAEYRTSGDYTRGASPSKLRGTFAIAALSDGHLGVVDVEDWDAPCRRPIQSNSSSVPDWRGCSNDLSLPNGLYALSDGTRTVSDESSCRVVEEHHARSGRFFANNTTVGTSAPSLQTFPTLTSITGNVATDSSSKATANPRMLAVAFPNPPEVSEVFVGSTLYYLSNGSTPPNNATLLSVNPAVASNNSLLLPLVEPRTYLPAENFSVTFEGKLFDDRQTGFLSLSDFDAGLELTLADHDAGFCDQGVEDSDAAAKQAKQFVSTDTQLQDAQTAAFALDHTDKVQVTIDFTDSNPYWSTPVGAACAKDDKLGVSGISGCRTYFGTPTDFKDTREWRILEAYQDKLVLDPASHDATALANLHCCFPATVLYTVRAPNTWLFRGQQPMTNVVVNPASNRCVINDECNPRKQLLRNRIIEISSTDTSCGDACSIGAPTTKSPVCAVSRIISPT